MQKLNGVLSILNWYISSLIPLLPRTRICASKWIKSTDFQSKYAKTKPQPWTDWNNGTWSRSPLYFDLRLSSHSLIHTDRSRLREQTRALVELLQSSIGQRRRNTIHMFYRQGFFLGGGAVNSSKRQRPPSTTAALPSSDPVPADRAIPSLRTECLTVVVNVWGGQLNCILEGSREWPVQDSSHSPAEFGAQWAKTQVQVIAGWMGDRQTAGQMRIRITLWSEDQEAFIALEHELVMTGHSFGESFPPICTKALILNSVQLFISFLSSNCLKNQRVSLSEPTLTSDVSLWQFLQARDTEEKARSAWSNFPPWKFRKNVVKGSCRSGGEKKSLCW